MPAATIVIGVYNRGHQIGACLDSLLGSTFRDFEIVLVEDCSTDDSAEVLERYRAGHPGCDIRIIENPLNLGAAGARNVGIDAARGAWVFFIDSDCVVEPAWLSEMMRAATHGGAVALSGTVLDKPPENLAERAYRGSCLISRKAPNLMECNMGLRLDVARAYRFDDAIAYGGEGDDITRRLGASGLRVEFVPAAVVHHHHAMGLRGYMRMAWRLGQGHARYWYKHGIWVGRDIAPLLACAATLPLAALGRAWAALPASLLCLHVAALLLNEVHYKGKRVAEALRVLPVSFAYAAVRGASVVATLARIATGAGEHGIRASRRRWDSVRSRPGSTEA